MKKDNIRDYATAAFRFYDREGRPTRDEIKENLDKAVFEIMHREISSGGISKPTEAAVLRKEEMEERTLTENLDIIAVELTMRRLSREEKTAVELVYFKDSDKMLEKGDITMRVHAASLYIPASERSVWYMLNKAARIFAEERMLRKDPVF